MNERQNGKKYMANQRNMTNATRNNVHHTQTMPDGELTPIRLQKLVFFAVILLTLTFLLFIPFQTMAEENTGKSSGHRENGTEETIDLTPHATSSILMDASTGTVMFEKNPHQKLPPASITKIMTMLLIMEALDNGSIALDEQVHVSEHAASMGGSQVFLEPGEQMTVEELLKGIAIASGNDAAVAMAEHIAGTEELFVQKMNDKARELGMKETNFVNCNGLPAEGHYTSAHDIALMSRELLKYEAITKYTGTYQDYLRQDTNKPFWLVNTNKLVRFYEGVDGLKTGYTSEAGFCLAATAKKENFRVIAVSMGEPDTKTRNREITQLLDYAFSTFKTYLVYKKDEKITSVKIDKGTKRQMYLYAPYDLQILMRKGEDPKKYEKEIVFNEPIEAPLTKDEVVGQLVIKKDGEVVYHYDLTIPVEVKRASLWEILGRSTKEILFPFAQ